MSETFYTILTSLGLSKFANAQVSNTPIEFTQLSVGDSNGSYYNPTANATNLRNEVWRGNINSVALDQDNPNWIVVEATVPATVGGFTIREIGVLDSSGNLLAIGKLPATYKPALEQGSSKDLYLKIILEVSNASSVTLKVDPSVTLASREYVTNLIGPINDSLQQLSNAGQNQTQAIEGILSEIGSIEGLETEVKTSLVDAINNLQQLIVSNTGDMNTVTEEISSISNSIGNLEDLNTDIKSSLVAAINEIKSTLATHSADDAAHGIGNKSTLLTTNKTSIVSAVNELFTNVSDGKNSIATAITDKGGSASGGDDFSQLASAIGGLGGGIKSIQNIRTTFANGLLNRDIAVSSVDLDTSIVLVDVGYDDPHVNIGNMAVIARFLNNSTVRLERLEAGTTLNIQLKIIEFEKVNSLQSGLIENIGYVSYPINSVDISKSLLFSSRANNSTQNGVIGAIFHAYFADSSNIKFDFYPAGTSRAHYFVVEFD